MELNYIKGGPDPCGNAIIYANYEKAETTEYLAIEVSHEIIDDKDLPDKKTLEQLLEKALPGKQVKATPFGIQLKVKPITFDDDTFMTTYTGDVINAGHITSIPEAFVRVTTVSQLYSLHYIKNKLEGMNRPRQDPTYTQFKEPEKLTEHLRTTLHFYEVALNETDDASMIATRLRKFAYETPIESQIEGMLRIIRANHPRKQELIPLILDECKAIFTEEYETAAHLRDEIRNTLRTEH